MPYTLSSCTKLMLKNPNLPKSMAYTIYKGGGNEKVQSTTKNIVHLLLNLKMK